MTCSEFERVLNHCAHLTKFWLFLRVGEFCLFVLLTSRTFHSYYEWNGWNPTCSADDPPAGTGDGGRNTPMLQVLTGYWKQNQSL